MQTIFALATARAKSGVAVIRLSGPSAFEITEQLCGSLPDPGCFSLRTIRDQAGDVLDTGLVLTFKEPASFTGEDVVELQLHGSLAVIDAVGDAISRSGKARLAEPGEFTKRALLNGRMDLPEVEGLSDLISAQTDAQRRQAQTLFTGNLREFADICREKLIRAAALLEATIDFADEDVPVDVFPEVLELAESVKHDLEQQLAGFAAAQRLRAGFEVAIIGAPNTGKSTLINRIAQREIAITSEVAGTTRDVLEVTVDLFGLPVRFLDTAGLREANDVVEAIGVGRARARAGDADLRIVLQSHEKDNIDVDLKGEDVVLGAKADITGFGVSGLTGLGVDELLRRVHEILASRMASDVVASHERHRLAMLSGLQALEAVQEELSFGEVGVEIVAFRLREGLSALDSLVGRVDVEAILGDIFSQFCIGK